MATKKTTGRPFEFPDPNDRSVNEPHVKLERREILGLYNQANPDADAKNVSDTVKSWLVDEGKRQGFSSIQFVESTAILGANVKVIPNGGDA